MLRKDIIQQTCKSLAVSYAQNLKNHPKKGKNQRETFFFRLSLFENLYLSWYQRDCLRRLIKDEWKNVEAKRLVKRLRRHRKELLVFLYHDEVPFDNNHAERTIRNGVVMRKNSD